jgi:hypothetical protein
MKLIFPFFQKIEKIQHIIYVNTSRLYIKVVLDAMVEQILIPWHESHRLLPCVSDLKINYKLYMSQYFFTELDKQQKPRILEIGFYRGFALL